MSTPATVFADRVQETTTTTGTGDYTLAGAVTGFQTFAAIGDTRRCYYAAWEVDAAGVASGGWEVGIGTYTASGTTLARATVIASTNSNNAVSWAAGTRRIACVDPAVRARFPDVQIFTASGTWTKPSGAQLIAAAGIGSGGGGGAGRKGAVARAGGGAGGGGAFEKMAATPADFFTSTVAVTIPNGGAGGIAQTTNSTDGANGTSPADVTFGAYLVCDSGVRGTGGSAGSGAGGAGGTGSLNGGAGGTGDDVVDGTAGGSGAAAGGGGGGGGVTTGAAALNGGAGGNRSTLDDGAGGGTAGVAAGTTAGGAGGSVTGEVIRGGAGGGGGAGSTTTNAGAGGAGGLYGGGGGGGGAGTNSVGDSGAGGAGGKGILTVISW